MGIHTAKPSRRSMQRVRDKLRTLIGRETRVSLGEKIARLNPVLRGWGTYFSSLNAARHFRLIDKYVDYKLRRRNCARIPRLAYNPLSPTGCSRESTRAPSR